MDIDSWQVGRTDPVFLVDDIAATVRWYQEQLGFDVHPVPSSPPHVFCTMWRDNAIIMLQALEGYRKPDVYTQRPGGVWNVYVRTRNVKNLFKELSSRTAVTILQPLHRQDYGQWEFEVRDPNGYVLVFAEAIDAVL